MAYYTYRSLSYNEILWAKNVFDNSLPYNNIYIADGYLPGNNGTAVTCMAQRLDAANQAVADYSIYFGINVYRNGADNVAYSLDTFIHELTHVWQGHNEGVVAFNYMVRSLASQAQAIATHLDRNKAYEYDSNNYLKWSDYSVEQQGNIVADWFSQDSRKPNRGNGSTTDPRFVYIDKVIRAGNPYAPDTPTTYQSQNTNQTPAGFSPTVLAHQRLLIKKGYKIKDDGVFGTRTDKAIRDFQRRNGLKVTGVVGPKTLALLKKP